MPPEPDIISQAITLASRNTSAPPCRSTHRHTSEQPRVRIPDPSPPNQGLHPDRPPTPHPVTGSFLAPILTTSPTTFYCTPPPVNPFVFCRPFEERDSPTEAVIPRVIELHCYYPEQLYIGDAPPQRNKLALTEFKDHCKELYLSSSTDNVIFAQPISQALTITSHILNFEGLVWRTKTSIGPAGIFEDYSHIHRQIRHGRADRAVLTQRFQVFYPWNDDIWSTRVFSDQYQPASA